MIVVADDGSTDGTAAVLDRHESLQLLPLPHRGKAAALNAALLAVDTDVVVTMDADTLPAPDAIAAIRHAFASDPALVVAGGVLIPVCGRTIRNRLLQWFQTYEYLGNFIVAGRARRAVHFHSAAAHRGAAGVVAVPHRPPDVGSAAPQRFW